MARATRRFRILVILAAAGAVLVALRLLLPEDAGGVAPGASAAVFDRELGAALDSLIVAHGIDPRDIRTREISLPDGTELRTEQRMTVPESFVALRFNHDLASRLRWTGARVVGTERVREGLTALHVVRAGTTVWTLHFVR